METGFSYSSAEWRALREIAIARDAGRCTVSRLLGGRCSSGSPHVHHIEALEDGGAPFDLDNLATVCASHHPSWEALRRKLVATRHRRVHVPKPRGRPKPIQVVSPLPDPEPGVPPPPETLAVIAAMRERARQRAVARAAA